MTVKLFGKGDDIAVPHLYPHATMFGSQFIYTEPSLDWCYSKYGFTIPTNYEAIPYHILLENKLPKTPDGVKRFSISPSYLLVDREGIIWDVTHGTENDERAITFQYVYNDGNTWWIRALSEETMSDKDEYLLGLLKTNPEKEKIEELIFKRHAGNRIQWLSIKDIVTTLNERYPESEQKTGDE